MVLRVLGDPTVDAAAIIAFMCSGGAAVAILGMLCKGVLAPRDWWAGPNVAKFSQHLREYQDDALVEWAGDEYSKSIEHNKNALEDKAKRLTLMTWIVSLQAVFSAIAWCIALVF